MRKVFLFLCSIFLIMISCSKEPSCLDGKQNGDETGIDCGGSCPACPIEYKIGDRGPGTGIIFYDKGNFDNGWRYLEAAPSDQSTSAIWGCQAIEIGSTSISLGFGLENSERIISKCKSTISPQLFGKAASLCLNLVIGGKSDWFLPSKAELNEMYKKKLLIGEFKNVAYWSSSEVRPDDAWLQEFINGDQYDDFKSEGKAIRAIRRF